MQFTVVKLLLKNTTIFTIVYVLQFIYYSKLQNFLQYTIVYCSKTTIVRFKNTTIFTIEYIGYTMEARFRQVKEKKNAGHNSLF